MIKITLNKDKDNIGTMLGISPERVEEMRDILSDFGARGAIKAKKEVEGKEIGNIMVELTQALSPETSEEVAYIFYSIPKFMEMYVALVENGIEGGIETLLRTL